MNRDLIEKFKNVKVLDCSIRDGGHINKWEFDRDFVKNLFEAVSKSGIDIVELGYRTSPDLMKESGAWRHTPDELIASIIDNTNIKIAIMADLGKISKDDFKPKEETNIDVIRLAFYKDNIDEAIELSEDLIEKGYIVTFNLMATTKYSKEDIKSAIGKIKSSNVDIMYIADSFGSLYPDEVANLIKIFKEGTGKSIGFHPHNNLQLALANTIAAIEAGATYVDGTMGGMGRGAGNLPLESILLFLNKFNNERYDVIPVLEFIEKDLKEARKDLDWGYDVNYLLSAMSSCHPNYSQALKSKGYSIDRIFSVLSTLKNIDNIGFDEKLLQKAIDKTILVDEQSKAADLSKVEISHSRETPGYLERHKGKDFLIVANGPTLNQYSEELRKFSEKNNLVVIGCNYLGKNIVPDYHIFNNFERFKKYVSSMDTKSKLMFGSYLAENVKTLSSLPDYEVIQYVSREGFDIKDGIIYTDPSTVGVLMISLAITMGANQIYVAGMDGYKNIAKTHFYDEETIARLDSKTFLQRKMSDDLKRIKEFQESKGLKPFKIITPTTFDEFYEKGVL